MEAMTPPLLGTVAVTDHDWYLRLSSYPQLDEVNFWKPSANVAFHAPEFSPFFFKLRSPHNAICGFGYFARYSRLPDWLAWEAFSVGNGCDSLQEMRERIGGIRERIRFKGGQGAADIGCIIIVEPVFFPPERWVKQPNDWKVRTQAHKKYELTQGEGARVLAECLMAAKPGPSGGRAGSVREPEARYGTPVLVRPRLGQGAFRITVTDVYNRCCAVTQEHSLPALEAAHIRPYTNHGPHEATNGILLRADFHRLFDKGYVTVTDDARLVVSRRLREDYDNGKSYYPFDGHVLRLPASSENQPSSEYLQWHRENCFLG